MENEEKRDIVLNIGGQRIATKVANADVEARLRSIEAKFNQKWKFLKLGHPKKTEAELLAMMAFQYACYYFDTEERYKKRETDLHDFIKAFEDRMNAIIVDV